MTNDEKELAEARAESAKLKEAAPTAEKVPDTWTDENEIIPWLAKLGYHSKTLIAQIADLYNGGFRKGRDMALSLRVDTKAVEHAGPVADCQRQRADKAEAACAVYRQFLDNESHFEGWRADMEGKPKTALEHNIQELRRHVGEHGQFLLDERDQLRNEVALLKQSAFCPFCGKKRDA